MLKISPAAFALRLNVWRHLLDDSQKYWPVTSYDCEHFSRQYTSISCLCDSPIGRTRGCRRPDPLSPTASRPRSIVNRVVYSIGGDRIDCCHYKAWIVVLLSTNVRVCQENFHLRLTLPIAQAGDNQNYYLTWAYVLEIVVINGITTSLTLTIL